MPIDPKQVKWDDEIDPNKVVWDDSVRNPVMDKRKASEEMAQGEAYTKRRKHLDRMESDPYYATTQDQNFAQNALASIGGVFKGLGYVGPRQIFGMGKPGEYQDWKASMEALNTTGGGKTGSFLGYGLPLAATAPVTGASAPLTAVAAGVESFLDPADSTAQRLWKTGIGAGTAGAGQKMANVIGNAATKARATRQLASYPGAEDVRSSTLRNTLELGYKLPPSASGKQSLLETVGGQIKTQQMASDANQKITDALIRKEMEDAARFGFRVTPATPLTTETMRGIRAAAARPYEDIKALGRLPTGKSKQVTQTVDRVGEIVLPKPMQVTKTVQSEIDAGKAIEQLKQFRHDGYDMLSKARASGDPDAFTQARKLLDDAANLEKSLEKGLQKAGKKDLLDDLKAARTLIAKTHNIQDAIRESVGSVDARDIGALYEAGEKGFGPKLTGRLADVGKAGSAFQESMALRGFDTPRYSTLDFAVSGLNAANANTPAGMLMSGIPLLRGPARDKMLSEAFQKKLMPNSVPPGPLVKAAPWLFDYTPNIPGIGPFPLSRTLPPSIYTGGLLFDASE